MTVESEARRAPSPRECFTTRNQKGADPEAELKAFSKQTPGWKRFLRTLFVFVIVSVLVFGWSDRSNAGLYTDHPIFTEQNSSASENSASYLIFRKIWIETIRGRYWDEALRLGHEARVIEHAGLTILQIQQPLGFEYVAVSFTDRGAPLICTVANIPHIDHEAEYHRVSFEIRKLPSGKHFVIGGDPERIMAFVRSTFKERNLACTLWRTMN